MLENCACETSVDRMADCALKVCCVLHAKRIVADYSIHHSFNVTKVRVQFSAVPMSCVSKEDTLSALFQLNQLNNECQIRAAS